MCSNSATVDAVFDSLGSFYWSSLTREVANLILAYREFLDEQDGPTNYESQTTVDGGPNFERFCSIWGKIDTRHKSDPETEIDLCQPDHLRKQFGNKAKAKNQLKFESRLRDKELRDNGVESPTWRRVANSLVDPTRYGNAGTIHFGVTFGPLMIQNGIPLPQKSLLSGIENDPMEGIEVRIFDNKQSGERMIRRVPTEERSIQFLGCAKKVYGGAFCGHADAFREEEQRIVDCFVEKASSYRYLPNKDVIANARRLSLHSKGVVKKIRDVFEIEINTYLQKLAETLSDKSTPLRWDLHTNNCQEFAQKLLRNLNIACLFHKLPRNYFSDDTARFKKRWPYLRYLLSFGEQIDTPIALLRPQVKSLVWRYYHAKRDYCDMIEFAEHFRTKRCVMPTDAWEVLCDEDLATGEDSIAKVHGLTLAGALWTLPRDTLSIIQTHLMRDWSRYSDTEGRKLTKHQWVVNRLRVLHQLDMFGSLSSSLLSAIIEEVGKTPDAIHYCYSPTGEAHGTLHVTERVIQAPGIMFVTGRERDWMKREISHIVQKLKLKYLSKVGDIHESRR
ncbi:hypothetical protein PG988_007911 [Apiospora saccharicola]